MNLTLEDMAKILEIYGGNVPKAPDGWEFTGEFRKPASSEIWLGAKGAVGKGIWEPRLILRKLPEPPKVMEFTISTKNVYPHGYEIPEGYESLGFGLEHPEAAEYLAALTGLMFPIGYKAPADVRILLKRKA